MSQPYYVESDGGDFWTGDYWSRQPKTYYVMGPLGRVDDEDYRTRQEAGRVADRLNVAHNLCKA